MEMTIGSGRGAVRAEENKKLFVYNDHSNDEQRNKILELLQSSFTLASKPTFISFIK